MRFQITFNRVGRPRMLPIDYQYYISAWIYKVFGNADSDFADFLHGQGYTDGFRYFKHFCYSPLGLGKATLWKEKSLLEVHNDTVYLEISFYLHDTAEKFIIGLFNNQSVYLGDRFNGIDLKVSLVERLPEFQIKRKMTYKALSPVVAGYYSEKGKYVEYISPENEHFESLMYNNFEHKFKSLPNNIINWPGNEMSFKLLSKPRPKLITISPGSREENKIRGFLFDFELEAPEITHNMILSSGFMEKNASGFGWCTVKR